MLVFVVYGMRVAWLGCLWFACNSSCLDIPCCFMRLRWLVIVCLFLVCFCVLVVVLMWCFIVVFDYCCVRFVIRVCFEMFAVLLL